MFSLIITIISIALVAALALATLYYGGDAFNKGTAGAEASRLINEGQQVNGAVALAKADAKVGATTTLENLVTLKYMSQLPGSFASQGATLAEADAVTVASTELVCEEVQKRAGAEGEVVAAAPAGQLYGCTVDNVTTPTAWTFYFKL